MRLKEVAKQNKGEIKKAVLPVLRASFFTSDFVRANIFRPEASDESAYMEDKARRAAEYVGIFLAQNGSLPEARFRISDRPENQAYLDMVAAGVHRRLERWGMTNWQVDMASSIEAGMVPNPNGYGNQTIKIPGPTQLVLRKIIKQPAELTLVLGTPSHPLEPVELEQVAA